MNQREKQKTSKDMNKPEVAPHHQYPEEGAALPLLVLNDLLKVPVRFNIMFLLYTYDRVGFTRLQRLLHSTPGNLDHHLKKLIEAGWIADTIVFSPRPLKLFKITPSGRMEFNDYVQHLHKIIQTLPQDHRETD